MTKQAVKVEVNNFVQGLVTEASPLNFPANATTDELNFVLNRDGTRDRRLGMDLEDAADFIPAGVAIGELNSNLPIPFKWLNANGNASLNVLVIQTGANLLFFNLNNERISDSGSLGTISLAAYGFSALTRFSFAAVNGKLVVAAGVGNIVIVSYNGITFSSTSRTLKTRDIWGIEVTADPLYESDIQYRGGMSDPHHYNLYNQSWSIPRQHILGGPPVMGDPVDVYFSALAKYPSNSEVVWTGVQYQPVTAGADPYERMYPALFEQSFGANVKAAKGYFIIDLLRRGESRNDAVVANHAKYPTGVSLASITTVDDITEGGAKVVCEFAGRVWYAGFNNQVTDGDERSPALASYVAFSQLVKNTNDINKCYQEGDPTSRENNDLLDTDGGLIRLSGVENVLGMVNIGLSLIIFASNGVWSVTGGDRNGFTATNYKVDRLSTFGTISPQSIVTDGSKALYWAVDGIYVVEKNQLGDLVVSNIIQKNIQSYYEQIALSSKATAIGVFEAANKKIRWLYRVGPSFAGNYTTYELILDLTLGAFYPFRISRIGTYDVEAIAPFSHTPFTHDNAGSRENSVVDTRYLVLIILGGVPHFTFGYYKNTNFRDWEAVDTVGADASGFITTGAVTANDSSVTKQVPYLTLHFRRTEVGVDENMQPLFPSSCLVRSQWDWANSPNSNKWSSAFQGYRQRNEYIVSGPEDTYDTGFEVITSKSKLRGRGRAFALHMETEAGKDCRILGWSISINGNSF